MPCLQDEIRDRENGLATKMLQVRLLPTCLAPQRVLAGQDLNKFERTRNRHRMTEIVELCARYVKFIKEQLDLFAEPEDD